MNLCPVGVLNEENRRPTNVYWLYTFLAVVITFVVLGLVASSSDGPSGIFYDKTGPLHEIKGSHCGIDSDVLDKRYIIRIDDSFCERNRANCDENWICVKSCPKGSFDATTCSSSNFNALKEGIVCQDDKFRTNINNCVELQEAINDKKCVRWYKNTINLFGDCISTENYETDIDVNEFESNVTEKIFFILPRFFEAIVIAVGVSLLFSFTLKWSAAVVFWGFVTLTIVILVSFLFMIIIQQVPDASGTNDGMNAIYMQLGILTMTLLFFLLFLYCMRHKIRCGIEIVKESSRCVCASIGTIFFPILPLILRAGVFIATMYIVIMALTMQENHYSVVTKDDSNCICEKSFYSDGFSCDPKAFNNDCRTKDGEICTQKICQLVSQSESSLVIPVIWLTLMIMPWIVAFIQANAKMILAHVYGNWYWTYNREYIPAGALLVATKKILSNHLGTAAFGSFIVMLLRSVRKMLNNKNKSSCCWCCKLGCCSCFMACFIRIFIEILRCFATAAVDLLVFITDKAFVVVAITGYGFWDSVKHVSRIMATDIPLVVATEYVGDIILFVCKFVAASLAAASFYFSTPLKEDDGWVVFWMSLLIFWLAFDLAAVLLTAYNVAIDTLLVCTIQDYMNSGVEKPYFQSQILNGLLLKKDVELV